MFIPIQLKSKEDVMELNNFAFSLGYNTFVNSNTASIDARSLLGLFAMIGRDDLHFVVPDHADPNKSFKGVWKFTKN